jgi:NADH-quinone oxidoreductase subunit L
MTMSKILLLIPVLPLIAAVVVGLFGRQLPRSAAHVITIAGVGFAFALSAFIFLETLDGFTTNETVYTWLTSG